MTVARAADHIRSHLNENEDASKGALEDSLQQHDSCKTTAQAARALLPMTVARKRALLSYVHKRIYA